jgi:hypothetical protein
MVVKTGLRDCSALYKKYFVVLNSNKINWFQNKVFLLSGKFVSWSVCWYPQWVTWPWSWDQCRQIHCKVINYLVSTLSSKPQWIEIMSKIGKLLKRGKIIKVFDLEGESAWTSWYHCITVKFEIKLLEAKIKSFWTW